MDTEHGGNTVCARCKEAKPREKFYTRKNGNPLSYCMECQRNIKELKFQENLERILEERQGACADCKFVYPIVVYEFYNEGHIFPLSKAINMSFAKIKEELAEYDLLCRNCSAVRQWEAGK